MFNLIIFVSFLSITTNVVDGKYVYRQQIHGSLAQHKVIATWDEAQKQCRSEGANLASPIDVVFLRELKLLTGSGHDDTYFYIGTRAEHYSGPYLSMEGVSLDDMPLSDMFDQLDPRQGDCLAMNRHNITNVPCWTRLPFLCFVNKTKTPDVQPDVSDRCDTRIPGYKYYPSGSCYKVHQDMQVFGEAERICAEEHGYLAIINDENEALVVGTIEGVPTEYPWMFVGLSAKDDYGDWSTHAGVPVENLYNVWKERSSKPTESGDFPCAVFSEGALLGQRCDWNKPYLCEKDAIPVVRYVENPDE